MRGEGGTAQASLVAQLVKNPPATQETWVGSLGWENPLEKGKAAAAAKSLQSCQTLCDPIDGSPPGSPALGFSRQEHWSGLPFPPPEDLPHSGIKPASLTSPALAGGLFTTSNTWEAQYGW